MFLTLSTIWSFLALCLLIYAWISIKRGKVLVHRRIMIMLTLAAWLFIIAYLSGDQGSLQRDEIDSGQIVWLAIHGMGGLIVLLGASMLALSRLFAKGSQVINRHHRMVGRVVMLVWSFTHIGGIVNYFMFAI